MKKIFVIDNYDSFTYNLVHYLEEFDAKVTVRRNDQFELSEIEDYEYLLLSPGPGIPDEAGLLKAAIERYAASKKILGVCLGWCLCRRFLLHKFVIFLLLRILIMANPP